MEFKLGEDFALEMDAKDSLAGFKDRFYHFKDSIYSDRKRFRFFPRGFF